MALSDAELHALAETITHSHIDSAFGELARWALRLEQERDESHKDSDILRHSNIIEIAVRNESGSVSDYMKHWEWRAEKAEAELAEWKQKEYSAQNAALELLHQRDAARAELATLREGLSNLTRYHHSPPYPAHKMMSPFKTDPENPERGEWVKWSDIAKLLKKK